MYCTLLIINFGLRFQVFACRLQSQIFRLTMVVQNAGEMNRPTPAAPRNSVVRSDRPVMRSISTESPCPLVLASSRDHGGSVHSMSSWLDEQLRRIGAAPPASPADRIDAPRLPRKSRAAHTPLTPPPPRPAPACAGGLPTLPPTTQTLTRTAPGRRREALGACSPPPRPCG
jgi:hypothetical protein